MLSLSKSQNFLSSPNVDTEKRKVLLRSACSFSIVEDNIIAPTPTRKLASVPSSPIQKRREKRSKPAQESLFGEAGEEIQTILFHSVEELPIQRVATPKRLDFSMPLAHCPFPQDQPYLESEPKEIAKLSRAAILAMEPIEMPSPPLRASNPITMNSVFHADEPTNAATSALREEKKKSLNLPDGRNKRESKTVKATKEKEMRFRSASWPALSSLVTSN